MRGSRWLFAATIIVLTGANQKPQQRCTKTSCINDANCVICDFPEDCTMGESIKVNCSTVSECPVQESMMKESRCMYCWQLEPTEYNCAPRTNCSTVSTQLIATECEVHSDVVCKGNRKFSKKIRCNWTSGTSWTKAMILSITLGGFGVDRFYLGLWKSAIGKLFSFGGLGVWTVADVVLIGTGYIRPADGSMYM